MKRVFIVHAWEATPNSHWYNWLKKSLSIWGYKVVIPTMPDTKHPKMKDWIARLKSDVLIPDKNTYFVGHSIGCQTILRYLESLNKEEKIGGVVLVAPWVHLSPLILGDAESYKIAKPWLETPIDWQKIITHTANFTALFSENDPYVPITDSHIFREKLNAKLIIEEDMGHFESDYVKKLNVVLKELKSM